ncbi:hypothetical protein RhiirC2_867148 [Rhizophagus irregularis]|uniref:Uncharacterized protein n=1 Tax=Rhizophagus irregularis TaxID=588596 RepID=A0A2N1N453_9GLOM|nr:hypothetical protein RhiirC2_867148 [Rhizophagus irregularis]
MANTPFLPDYNFLNRSIHKQNKKILFYLDCFHSRHIDNFGALELQIRSWLFLRQPRRLEFKVLVSALRLNYKTCEGSGERKNQILALSSTTLALWNFRSQFFSISALRFEGPGSSSTTSVFDIQFHILVLRSQFFLRLLRHLGISVSHTEKGERK